MQQKEHVWQEERSFSRGRRKSMQEVGRLAEGSGSLELNGCLARLLWSNTCAQKKWLEVSPCVFPCVFLTANHLSHARLWQTEHPEQGVNAAAATPAAFKTSTCAEDQDSASSEKKIFIIISWICSSECCEFKAGSSVLFNVNCCCWCCCCCCCCCCSQEFSGGDVQYRNRRRGRSRECHGVGKAKKFLRPCSRTNLHNCWRFLRLHPATSVLHTVSQLSQLPPSLLPVLHPLWKQLCPVLCQLFSPSPIHTIALKVSTIFIKRGTKKHEKVTFDETPPRRCCRPPPRRFNFPFRRDIWEIRRNELNGGPFSTQSFVCLGFSIRGKWVCDNFCNYSLSNDLSSWRLKLLPTSTDKLHLIVGFT